MPLWGMVRVMFLVVVSLGLLSQPNDRAASHVLMPTLVEEATRHAVLAANDALEHEHSHDDGEPYEKIAGHAHGHDPADHSHQVAFVSVNTFRAVKFPKTNPLSTSPDLVRQQSGFGIDRPPKHQTLA